MLQMTLLLNIPSIFRMVLLINGICWLYLKLLALNASLPCPTIAQSRVCPSRG